MKTYFSHFVKTKRGSFKVQNSNHFKKLKAGKNVHTVVSEFRYFPAEIEFADWSLSRAVGPQKNIFEKHFWKWILTFVSICSFTANHHSMASGNDLTDSIVSNDDLLNTALLYAKYW